MSFKKFGENDVLINTMVAYPHCEFFIYLADIYYNDIPTHGGTARAVNLGPGDPKGSGPNPASPYSAVAEARMVPLGAINLYEYNVDRPDTYTSDSPAIGLVNSESAGEHFTPQNYSDAVNACDAVGTPITFVADKGRIFPWISKDSAGSSWKTISATSYATEYQYGSIVEAEYPLSGFIKRELIEGWDGVPTSNTGPSGSLNKHYYSLKNRLNFYGVRSVHYKVSASIETQSWNKDIQALNTIAIPSIFFGSRIKPGTVSLKYYITGTLAAELQDRRQNGELIQVSGSAQAAPHNNKTAGVIMYDEGYIILTGSWNLNTSTDTLGSSGLVSASSATVSGVPSWLNYAAGAGDGRDTGGDRSWPTDKVSFGLTFKGHTETQVVTLFTHAKRGEANFSNNPTYLQYGQDKLQYTSSQVYEENSKQLLANTVSSSYSDYDASFKRSVYISRVAVYDENKNIIGIATLANPVLKEEDRDYSIKLKLDI